LIGDKEKLLKDLVPLTKAIEVFERGNPLQPTSALFNAVLGNCIDILTKHGYIVRQLPQHIGRLNNVGDLVNHYYNLLKCKKSKVLPCRSTGPDLATAKSLIKNIQESMEYDYKDALHFAGRMVERVFVLEKDLKLEPHVFTAFRTVFGQDKMGWITEQVIASINKEANSQGHLQSLADIETDIYVKNKKVSFGWDDLEELVKELED
jgi:hypothetical protein